MPGNEKEGQTVKLIWHSSYIFNLLQRISKDFIKRIEYNYLIKTKNFAGDHEYKLNFLPKLMFFFLNVFYDIFCLLMN